MAAPPDLMRITPLGHASVATAAFRASGQLWVVPIVKATFTLTPDGPMALARPEPVVRADQPYVGRPPRSLAAAAETAPFLQRADVLLYGRAVGPGGAAVPRFGVRLLVSRDGQPLLDKRLVVQGPPDAAGNPTPVASQAIVWELAVGGPAYPENPTGSTDPARVRVIDPVDPRRPAGFGPIARSWPARQRLLGNLDPRTLAGGVAEIPDGFPWPYFQAAPPDQRVPALRGDEWVVLEGFHADRPRLASQLPGARGAARLYGPTPELLLGIPVQMVADTLCIDAERGVCTMVWRGRAPLAGEEGLRALELAAGVELPGQPIAFPPLPPSVAQAAAAAARPAQQPHHATQALSVAEIMQQVARPATPFERPSAPPPQSQPPPQPVPQPQPQPLLQPHPQPPLLQPHPRPPLFPQPQPQPLLQPQPQPQPQRQPQPEPFTPPPPPEVVMADDAAPAPEIAQPPPGPLASLFLDALARAHQAAPLPAR